jgi:UDP-GlcNAc:undecaprenyl-phosphate GlcNAc-1-phosphate transferase
MIVCWVAAWVVRKWGAKLGLVDRPGQRKIHARPMSTGGGLAIWAGVVAPLAVGQLALWILLSMKNSQPESLAWLPESISLHLDGLMARSGQLWILLGAGTVLVLLGLIDDLKGIRWQIRLLVEVIVAAVVVQLGWKMSLFVDIPWLTNLLSVLWIVILINSFNMLDNMDGLSAGVAAIAASMLAAVMLMMPDPTTGGPQLFVAGFLLVLVGSLLGFLVHNRPPARLFMGDTGSYLVGFLVAVSSLSATFAGGELPQHAILAPLCVLAVPLYDTFTVLCIRIRAGKSPFEGDNNHFSLRLVELGLSRPRAVLTIWLVTATCGLGALLLHQINFFGACLVLLQVVCILVVIAILEATARRKNRRKK